MSDEADHRAEPPASGAEGIRQIKKCVSGFGAKRQN
jgi:hypothetical protein